jgi:hypothetical protein
VNADMYSFEYHRGTQLLKVTQGGLLPPEMAASFAEELQGQIVAALAQSTDLKILIDASQAPVQQLASFAAAGKLREAMPNPPRTAVVLGSTLAKMQADRASISDVVRTFTSMSEALEWLGVSPDPASGPQSSPAADE